MVHHARNPTKHFSCGSALHTEMISLTDIHGTTLFPEEKSLDRGLGNLFSGVPVIGFSWNECVFIVLFPFSLCYLNGASCRSQCMGPDQVRHVDTKCWSNKAGQTTSGEKESVTF